ncbi:hypothetical protein CANCADRAFT_80537 [Tortispora caseinolytica NRRL Y-17796]|uniref:aspartyl aminopeptidase n=1 Tax=Tortispora caseinolytica NRRL Y-17796 TaxID=767744 RepID=A0A1E4TJP9_9ASCO|nr:hypothetical protein CANCADRAFT_80537 [Tortispora caseinolytica NRRL Y-17796]
MSIRRPAMEFINFINNSPTPYHAVANVAAMLKAHGFVQLKESDPSWTRSLSSNSKFFVTRNDSSIIAFSTLGLLSSPLNSFAIVGAHTDSPCLRVKPVSSKTANGFLQVAVETYGGGLWHTWFDRDLSVAGRVLYKKDNFIKAGLVDLKDPIMRIPTLAIHLNREASNKFEFNKETQLLPIAGLVSDNDATKSDSLDAQSAETVLPDIASRHLPGLLDRVARELGITSSDIVDFELVLHDTQPATLGGLQSELIFSPRLDNLNSTFCATEGLIQACEANIAPGIVPLISLFDHEEIGSESAQGARSHFLKTTLKRIYCSIADDGSQSLPDYDAVMANSLLLSADMAHGVHPNYASKHEDAHKPALNKGPVIKINANQRYATNSVGIALLQKIAGFESRPVPLQLFVVRNDSPCGSTIGPALSADLGMPTLDLGNPQLSMHSIRETGGRDDIDHAVNLYRKFFMYYGTAKTEMSIDIEY